MILTVVMTLAAVLVWTVSLSAQGSAEVQITTSTVPSAADVRRRLDAPGVREVEFRRLDLAPAQVDDAFLTTSANRNLLLQVGRELRPGEEADFRTVERPDRSGRPERIERVDRSGRH